MAGVIERLEYGIQAQVDSQRPGLLLHTLQSFLRDMLVPSAGSILESDISDRQPPRAQSQVGDKPLPPLPNGEQQTQDLQYHQDSVFQQTRSFLQPVEKDQSQTGAHSFPFTVEQWRLQQPQNDATMGATISGGFDFQWDHLAQDINVDPTRGNQFGGHVYQ